MSFCRIAGCVAAATSVVVVAGVAPSYAVTAPHARLTWPTASSTVESAPPDVGGSVTATIPCYVFVRIFGSDSVVSTNTGEPPTASDGYELVTADGAQPASAELRASVLAACG